MTGLTLALAARACRDPRVAVDLLTLAWAFRRRRWWHIAPFLPLPDRDYLEWRLHTAYGEERALPPVADVLRFARWRRRILSA
ncbi:MAG: hypothetical protein KA180_04050 [Gemmatimonadales bacterium]|nr:hypothetical protein [Gemmatimonadota bacterium]MBK9066138.1 hypothetical protein [Gemmatimonadota bacterium]MBK9693735.1 hypothetical protein [Gemmatimonadota bacterium]MBP6668598.1 hypothetical protein [Gemmatimonadales bacterium]MBP9198750.1 hypothetical protein [Gemmatimonadales bacterium]